jgi:hypothetical protein
MPGVGHTIFGLIAWLDENQGIGQKRGLSASFLLQYAMSEIYWGKPFYLLETT